VPSGVTSTRHHPRSRPGMPSATACGTCGEHEWVEELKPYREWHVPADLIGR
jgi:hypothetical protein